jgi:hypothetical protein
MPFQVGDWVVYTKTKSSTHPGPRAEQIHPAPQGESYRYVVDKYWRVARELDGDRLEIVTRTGKRHQLSAQDPNLRKPSWLERLRFRHRFPAADNGAENSP